ncbi:hypothetical protein Goari_011952 [Gossypium aridum]|uniref:Uncharacterized protein n=1 Tax=Gossypium aridum TaxID=34290 RepID=A0A7J8WYZ8_GOSAI|nr:hypothetical protein [Gossypium aridum]
MLSTNGRCCRRTWFSRYMC